MYRFPVLFSIINSHRLKKNDILLCASNFKLILVVEKRIARFN